MYTVTQIEDAIITRLKSQLKYLRTCTSLADYLRSQSQDITIEYPAAYVVYERGEYSYKISGAQDRVMYFALILMVENVRGEEEVRHGDRTEKGIYDVLDDVRSALTDQACGLTIDPLLPLDDQAIEGTENIAVYGIRFKTRCRFNL